MVVQHNLQAMNANRMLGVTTGAQAKSTEKLSSGYKINRAADDAAGLAISEKMRKQIKGLSQASRNAQDGISSVQTAEGALTEVHSMLQRMNELAVQASNGTNSESDRQSIQDEIDQLTTEIDRVAETTKFNETYLLKGNGKTSTMTIGAKDAGINGELFGVGTGTATFKMNALKNGDKIMIGGKQYTIGTTLSTVSQAIGNASIGSTVMINGIEYTVVATASLQGTGATAYHVDNQYTVKELQQMVTNGDKVVVGTKTFVAMVDNKADGISDKDATIISATKAYEYIARELRSASSIGTDPTITGAAVSATAAGTGNSASFKSMGALADTAGTTQVSFKIKEGQTLVDQGLQMALHVGADADGTNKIAFTLDTMSSKGLGVANLNLVDKSGAKATYAIDSISDAIAKVSKQRSTLGAIQNRLEHTISNLDNVVENTTSAESEIRDTDMAEEMVSFTKNNILAQAGQSMLAQANQSNQGVLSLLG